MTMRLPDFIIGGAPRSGTTWLTTLLDMHPDIWIAKPIRPEPKFFLLDEEFTKGLEYYSARWFADAPESMVAGEKSTNYLESQVAAARVAACLPRVRLLFVLRDPVARAVSNYRWSVMNGMEHEDLATALTLEQQRDRDVATELRYARPHAYFGRGAYAALLRPWYARLGPERILVIRFEDLVRAPGDTAAVAHSFLGVEPRPDLGGAVEGVNASADTSGVDPDTVARLRQAYAPLNAELAELLGWQQVPWTDEESRR